MKTSKHLQDPVLMGHVADLQAGKTTRKDIAEAMGISPTTLSKRFRACGLIDALKHTKALNPDTLFQRDPDNAKPYAAAAAYALEHPTKKVAAIHQLEQFKELNYAVLCRLVKKAKDSRKSAQKDVKMAQIEPKQAELTL